MKWNLNNPQARIYSIATIILAAGLTCSICIYLTTWDPAETFSGYDFEGSKKYVHDLELYGGKANLLAIELMQWFKGLWQGQTLAYTVACITVLISLGLFYVGYHLESGPTSDGRDKNRQDGSDG